MNLAGLFDAQALRQPQSIAVRCGAEVVSYGRFSEESRRIAGGLRAMGVGPGDRVVLFSENRPEVLVLYHAVASLGAVFAPVHPTYQSRELDYVLANARPAVAIVSAAMHSTFTHALHPESSLDMVVLDDLDGFSSSWAALRTAGEPLSVPVDVDADAPVLISYTSGTTDRPHPVVRSHRAEIWNAQTYADVWDYRDTDTALISLPLSWVYGLSTMSQALLSAGGCVDLQVDFSPARVVDALNTRGATLFAGTGTMYARLLASPEASKLRGRHSLRRIYVGGEPTDTSLMSQFEELVGLRLTQAYALTEAAPVLAMNPRVDDHAPQGAVGRLVSGAEIRLVDEIGGQVAPGEIGEALVRCPGIMTEYWEEPSLTAERLTPEGWFRTQDLLRVDADGYYFVVGRSSDIVIRAGARVAPAEVESALRTISTVAEAACVGVPDEEFGEAIVAFVVPAAGFAVSIDDLYDALSDRIARFKHPTHVFVRGELPVGLAGKRDRGAIRSLALALIRDDAESPVAG